MKKTHKEVESREVHVVDDVFCNKCGSSCLGKGYHGEGTYLEIQASWGYGSPKDGTEQVAHLCEPCWDTLCSTFFLPVEGYNYINGETFPEPQEVQLSLFTADEMSGDPYRMVQQCGYEPNHEGYDRCTRSIHHEGPCAHPLKPPSPLL